MLQISTVKPPTLELLVNIQKIQMLQSTRLVGGTALALLLGHRLSIDLDFYLEKYSDASLFLAYKSLVYFADAENQIMPKMIIPAKWETVKKRIISEVKQI